MKLSRRQSLHLAAGAAAIPAVSRIARAYPTRPVRIIVGFGAGGGSDIYARLLGQWLSERLAQPFIIENRVPAATSAPKRPASGASLARQRLQDHLSQIIGNVVPIVERTQGQQMGSGRGLLMRPNHADAWPLPGKAAVIADIAARLLMNRSGPRRS